MILYLKPSAFWLELPRSALLNAFLIFMLLLLLVKSVILTRVIANDLPGSAKKSSKKVS